MKGYLYEYKNKLYIVTGICKMKCPETRKWLDAVHYASTEHYEKYCREKSDFVKKFKRVV